MRQDKVSAHACLINTPLRGVTQAKPKPNDWDRKKLRRIIQDRYGSHNVPVDDRERVLALLLCGFKTKPILADAPWLEPDELALLRKTARKLSLDDVGRLIRLTLEDWLHYEAWRFPPCDRSPEEMKEHKREMRRAGKRKRYREQHQQQPCKIDRRMDAILRMIKNGPRAMPWLDRRARHSRAFPSVRHMGLIRPKLVKRHRERVRYAVKQLAALGLVALTMRKGVRGSVILVRKIPWERPKKFCPSKAENYSAFGRGRKRRRDNGLTPISHPLQLSAFVSRNAGVCSYARTHSNRVSTSSVGSKRLRSARIESPAPKPVGEEKISADGVIHPPGPDNEGRRVVSGVVLILETVRCAPGMEADALALAMSVRDAIGRALVQAG